MQLVPLAIEGAFGIIGISNRDARGSVTRVWDINQSLGNFRVVQSSFVRNPRIKTLRGLHFQSPPHSENKVVECISGKVYDVIVDLRENSDTFRKHLAVTLGPNEIYLGIHIPAGCAHGYLTLEEDTTLLYFMDKPYSPESACGILWSDPSLGITWPSQPDLISERDLSWQALQ